jgi:ribosomal protein L31
MKIKAETTDISCCKNYSVRVSIAINKIRVDILDRCFPEWTAEASINSLKYLRSNLPSILNHNNDFF